MMLGKVDESNFYKQKGIYQVLSLIITNQI